MSIARSWPVRLRPAPDRNSVTRMRPLPPPLSNTWAHVKTSAVELERSMIVPLPQSVLVPSVTLTRTVALSTRVCKSSSDWRSASVRGAIESSAATRLTTIRNRGGLPTFIASSVIERRDIQAADAEPNPPARVPTSPVSGHPPPMPCDELHAALRASTVCRSATGPGRNARSAARLVGRPIANSVPRGDRSSGHIAPRRCMMRRVVTGLATNLTHPASKASMAEDDFGIESLAAICTSIRRRSSAGGARRNCRAAGSPARGDSRRPRSITGWKSGSACRATKNWCKWRASCDAREAMSTRRTFQSPKCCRSMRSRFRCRRGPAAR